MKILKLTAALMLPLVAYAGPMKPGKWQVTVATTVAGMDDAVPPTTVTECITDEEAAKPQPPATGQGSDCKVSDYAVNGNVITWSISCPNEQLTGSGTMTFSGESYSGSTKMKIGDANITQKLTGKRLGGCDQ
jgi:uncharacterized protein DUF3617